MHPPYAVQTHTKILKCVKTTLKNRYQADTHYTIIEHSVKPLQNYLYGNARGNKGIMI
jgi:hypothetical protein